MAYWLSRMGRTVAILAVGLTLSALADTAYAQSRVCRQLRSELAELSTATRSTAQVRKYDAAIGTQRDQLRQAKAQARRSGCGFSLFGQGRGQCGPLNTKIEKMERNLEGLQRQRSALSGRANGRSRGQLQAALDANGCNGERMARKEPPRQVARAERDGGSLFEQLFGGGVKRRDSAAELLDGSLGRMDERQETRRILNPSGTGAVITIEPNMSRIRGELATVCVRTCDGYFFPMSNAASARDFARDQQNCESACPGIGVELYYHSSADKERTEMFSSVSGEPYSQLPAAYLYKQPGVQRPAGCGCNATTVQENFQVVAGGSAAAAASAGSITAIAPREQQGSIISKGPEPEPAATIAAPPKVEPVETDPQRKVRVVGPVFLPDPAEAIDLQVPARMPAR